MMLRRAMAVVAGAVLLAGDASRAQEVGSRVVITTKSGSRYTAVLESRDESELVLRIGDNRVSIPRSLVVSIEPAGDSGSAAPQAPPAAAPAPEGPASPPGTGAAAEDLPRPAGILLKDGTLLKGYVLSRDATRIWMAVGDAREVRVDQVDRIFGNAEPLAGGLRITGNAAKDASRLLKEVESGDRARMRTAQATIEALGEDALPALVEGLESRDSRTRLFCMTTLSGLKADSALDAVLRALQSDADAAVRATAAEMLVRYNLPRVRRILLEVAWRDRDDGARSAALRVLARIAGAEDVSALMDLTHILTPESGAWPLLFDALRKGSGQGLASEVALWDAWWNSTGREAMAAEFDRLRELEMRESQRKFLEMTGGQGTAPAGEKEGK